MCHWLFFLLRSSCEVDAAIIKENKLDLTTLAAIIKDKNLDLTLGSNVLFISPLSLLHNRLAILRISLDFLEFHPLWSRMISALLGAWIPSPPSFFFNLSSFLPLASLQPPFALFNFPFIPNVTKCKIGSHCAFKIFLCRLNLQGLIILKSASRSCQNAVCSIPRKVLRVGTSN